MNDFNRTNRTNIRQTKGNTMIGIHFLKRLAMAIAVFSSSALQAQDLNLTFVDGSHRNPFDSPNTKAVAMVFVTTDCPIANSYQPKLKEMAATFGPQGVEFVLVYPSPSTSPESIKAHCDEYQISIPAINDSSLAIARRFDARVTPEAIVFSAGDSQPVYRGRIDDRYTAYGKKRTQPTTHDLEDVLKGIVEGQHMTPTETTAVGCLIPIDKVAQQDKAEDSDYDPSRVDADETVNVLRFDIQDSSRERTIPIKVYLPATPGKHPVVLFSHGLGGSRENSVYLGEHWARRGYVCVFMQHIGSDESVWKDRKPREIRKALTDAASGASFNERVKDVPFVIDQLEAWNDEAGHELNGMMDLKKIGMTGHSFGAVTTQAVSGQSFVGSKRLQDKRIVCAIPLSPSKPKVGSAESAFGEVDIPWLLMTGTEDNAKIVGGADAENRRGVYPALPPGDKYELVLFDAQHSAFSDRELPGDRGQRNKNHHRVILALSTAFWDTYLKDDSQAREWLKGEGAKSVLEPKDEWQMK
ncbi:MAG: redoxin domain-containing protein [Pirellulaceae bacterium]